MSQWTPSHLLSTCTILLVCISLWRWRWHRNSFLIPPNKALLVMADDNSGEVELDSSKLHHCSGNTTGSDSAATYDTLLCLSSLLSDYAIPAMRNCPAASVLLPEARKSFFFDSTFCGLKYVLFYLPFTSSSLEKISDINDVSVSLTPGQACIFRV